MFPISRSYLIALCLMLPMAWSATAEAHRQFDPGKRRFAQRDPQLVNIVNPRLNTTEDANLYLYEGSNSVRHRDPTGMQHHSGRCPGGVPAGADGWTYCDWVGPGGDPWCVPCVNQTLPEPFYTCTLVHEMTHCSICNYEMNPPGGLGSCCRGRCTKQAKCKDALDCTYVECQAHCVTWTYCYKPSPFNETNSWKACFAKCICDECAKNIRYPSANQSCQTTCTGKPYP